MPDITMCTSDKCPIKNNCYRFTATPTEHWQSYNDFSKYIFQFKIDPDIVMCRKFLQDNRVTKKGEIMDASIEATKLTVPTLNEGEIYVGAIIAPDGTGHRVILLPGDVKDKDWDAAMEWAKSIGGDLPDRTEQALLFAHSKDQFKTEWYWSNTQHASYSICAWSQDFDDGNQSDDFKTYEGRARAVRRVPINQGALT